MPKQRRSCKVLVADGDQVSREQIGQVAVLEGCQVELASCGEDAIRAVSTGGIDVVIIEVHLPDMPAWVLVPRIRRADPDIPVIAITSDDSWETSWKVRIEGGPVFFYGLKPLALRELRQVLNSARRWRQRGRPNAIARNGNS